jgi:hypothetical protein
MISTNGEPIPATVTVTIQIKMAAMPGAPIRDLIVLKTPPGMKTVPGRAPKGKEVAVES